MKIPAIKKLGGVDEVVSHLRGAGISRISARAIRAWSSRGRVPGYAIIELSRWAAERGVSLSHLDFEPIDCTDPTIHSTRKETTS